MADPKMDVSSERRLRGKVNFITWKREFEREAKAHEVLDLFTGEEEILEKPQKGDYIDDDEDKDSITIASTQKTLKNFHANTLRYTIDYNNWKSNRDSLRTANKLLNAWLCESICIEIETAKNAKEAYDMVIARYKINNERARDDLLSEMRKLHIDDCNSVTEYLNKLRRFRSDLAGVDYDLTDGLYVTSLLDGLDNKKWGPFKDKWDTIRAIQLDANPDATPSIDLLEERLHNEALIKQRREDEKRKQDKAKPKPNISINSYSSFDNTKREDKSHLKCKACGKDRHTENNCWKLHPEKTPRALRDMTQIDNNDDFKSTKHIDHSTPGNMAAFVAADVVDFKTKLAATKSIGTHSSLPPVPHAPADPPSQTRKGIGAKVRGTGGDGDTGDGCKMQYGLAPLYNTMNAFMAGPVQSRDIWLADTAANMHIVNDPKWFAEFHALNANINTADNSTTLQVEGGGNVEVLLLNAQQQPIKLRLSDVAYAPKGRCNLLSLGLLAEKAGIHGYWDHRGMTLLTEDKSNIGYAAFYNGLFQVRIEPVPKPDNPFESGEALAAAIDFNDPVWRMHRRLGHLSFQGMLNLKKVSTGMNITEQQIKDKLKAICPVCATTRALVRIPRDPAKRKSTELGDLIHVDVWGPYPIEGYDATKLFLLMTDDYTRFIWCEKLKAKSELSEAFRRLHKRIEKEHKTTIRKYRCDNEFSQGPVGSWCRKHNISLEATVPYAHYMNGVAERNMRTVREKAASMIQDTTISGQISKIISEKSNELLRGSSIPANLWPEAFMHAIWNKNRAIARALLKKDKKTPWEALYRLQPSLERERIWGSRAYSAFPIEKRMPANVTKLHHPRGWLGYFVGCESESVYRIYDPEKHTVRRVGASEIDDGQGLDDPQDGPSLQDFSPAPNTILPEQDDLTYSDDDYDGASTDVSEPAEHLETQNALHFLQNSELSPLPVHPENHSDTDDADISDLSTNSTYKVTSKYFAGATTKRKKRSQAKEEQSSSDDADSLELSEMEQTMDEWVQPTIPGMNKNYSRYLPDNSKCNYCFLQKRICDRNTLGTTCTHCQRGGIHCIDQTKESQSLIHPKDRNRPRQIQATQRTEQKPPCRLCYEDGRACIRNGPEGTPCNRCKSRHVGQAILRCHFDLTDAVAPNKENSRAGGEHAVPYDQKCYRCAKQQRACNGKYPCNNCTTVITATSCMNVTEAREKKTLAKCTHCERDTRFCNKERPCSTCVRLKANCFYIDQEGLLTRSYKVDGAPILANQKLDLLKDEESSDDECLRCIVDRRSCSGSQPCYLCVKHHRNPNYHVSACNWRRRGGLLERYMVEPYTLDDEGRVILKDNHRDIITIARARGRFTGEDATDKSNRKRKRTDRLLQKSSSSQKDQKIAMLTSSDQRLPDPKTFAEAMASNEAKLWQQAITEERTSLEEKHTWDIVPTPKEVRPITSKLVFKRKYGPDGLVSRHKARLVARGFQQEEGIDYEETFAAVVKPASYRILFAIAAIYNWQIHQADVKTAFLNSSLPKPVHMRAPRGIDLPRGMCFLVLRAIYGLKQSPREWYQKFKSTMQSWEWRISAYDPCVFINDNTRLILQLHVDDITVFGSNLQEILEFKDQLSKAFQITDEGECSWYLGMHVEQKPGEIRIHQKQYIDQILAKYGFENIAPAYTPVSGKLTKQDNYIADPTFRQEYQSKVGSLNFAANQTRPDISFATGYVARYASNPNQSHMDAVNRIFAYLNNDRLKSIQYSGKHGFDLKGFVDSDFAGCEDSRRSTTGWVFTLAGGPISWASQRQRTVATSTLDAEYIAGAEAAKEAVWIRNFINDLRIPGLYVKSVPLYIDCNSALRLTHNPEFHSKSKHIDVKHHFIREKVEENTLTTERVNTKDNLADILTKALPRDTHKGLLTRMGLVETVSCERRGEC
jgi:hypothetical protein